MKLNWRFTAEWDNTIKGFELKLYFSIAFSFNIRLHRLYPPIYSLFENVSSVTHSFGFFFVQSFSRSINYHGESNFSALLTPITFLISYFNSAFNPLLYAFLSRNFRKGMREIILCSFKKSNKKSLQQRIPLHVSKSVFWQIFKCHFMQRKPKTDEIVSYQYN